MLREDIRNIAIIAHVDHGKTTLVDAMLNQSGTWRENEQHVERVMDSMDLERERGITIMAKNTSVRYGGVKINIVDTPGHADFGGEVERVLKMVDGVMLLVDAAEGCLPQTRFVLRKALEAGLPTIAVVNKIDRHDARPDEVSTNLRLFSISTPRRAIDFPSSTPCRARAWRRRLRTTRALRPLFDQASRPSPPRELRPTRCNCCPNLDYSDTRRLAIGHLLGEVRVATRLHRQARPPGEKTRVKELTSSRAEREAVEARAWHLRLAGMEAARSARPSRARTTRAAQPVIAVDEPTISMISAQQSPSPARGRFVTSRQIRDGSTARCSARPHPVEDRLARQFKVSGRGELQLSILIEMMRARARASVSKPESSRAARGKTLSPRAVVIDCPEVHGVVTEAMGRRKGQMTKMVNHGTGRVRLEFEAPSRGLIGFRSEFLTETKGTGLLNTLFLRWGEWLGAMRGRSTGSLVADRMGETTTYALFNLQERGSMFIRPTTRVYEGMIVGENARAVDLDVNIVREKKLTNMRAASADEAMRLVPVKELSLEQALEFIADDELVEVTPASIRLRKRVLQANRRPKKEA